MSHPFPDELELHRLLVSLPDLDCLIPRARRQGIFIHFDQIQDRVAMPQNILYALSLTIPHSDCLIPAATEHSVIVPFEQSPDIPKMSNIGPIIGTTLGAHIFVINMGGHSLKHNITAHNIFLTLGDFLARVPDVMVEEDQVTDSGGVAGQDFLGMLIRVEQGLASFELVCIVEIDHEGELRLDVVGAEVDSIEMPIEILVGLIPAEAKPVIQADWFPQSSFSRISGGNR